MGHLVTGNVANAAIMLLASIIAARALGPEVFGILTLVLALGRTTERVLRFESWQALIRFATLLETRKIDNDPAARRELAHLLSLGFWLDVAAAVLAAVVATLLAVLFGPVLGLPEEGVVLVAVYGIALLVNWSGMPTAALRLSGRFRSMAYYQFAASAARVLLALACWAAGGGLLGFVLVWTASQVANSLFLTGLALADLRRRGVEMPWRTSPQALRGRFPGFMGFAFSTNLSTTLRTLTVEADVLLVGAMAGPSAAGFYHIAKRLAKVAQQIGAQVQAVLYPDIARLWAQSRHRDFRIAVRQVQLALAASGLAALLAALVVGDQALRLAFGTAYADAFPLLIAQLVAVIFVLQAAPSRAALLAMNRPNTVLAVAAVGAVGFFAIAALLIPEWGALGASLAHIALAAFMAVGLGWRLRSETAQPASV